MDFFRNRRTNAGPAATSPDEYPMPAAKTQDGVNERNGAAPSGGNKTFWGAPMSPNRRKRLWRSYGFDWLFTIVVWVSINFSTTCDLMVSKSVSD